MAPKSAHICQTLPRYLHASWTTPLGSAPQTWYFQIPFWGIHISVGVPSPTSSATHLEGRKSPSVILFPQRILFLPWKLLTHQPSPVVFMSLPPFRWPRAGILCLSLNWSVCLQPCPPRSLLYAATGGIFLRHRLDHATILSDSSLDPHVPQDDSIKISYNVDPNKLHSHIPTKSITAATPRLSVLFLALGLRALRGEPRDR